MIYIILSYAFYDHIIVYDSIHYKSAVSNTWVITLKRVKWDFMRSKDKAGVRNGQKRKTR